MPREMFSIVVGTLAKADEQVAIADASAYLAFADQTDTFGYSPDIKTVKVYRDEDGPIAVDIRVSLAVENDAHLKRFVDQMTHLSRVRSLERGGV